VPVVSFVFGFILLVLALLGGTAVAMVKIIKGKAARQDEAQKSEEAKIIQELHQGLKRMEGRIEALETILLEKKAKKEDSL
jgi:phage shock protein B